MSKKTPKTRNAGTLTEAQFFAKIRSALRRAFRWWEPMKIALKRAERKNQSANKRLKFEYQCAHCKNWFPRKQVEIDHIVECGSLRSFEDIAGFVERLTQESPDAYQILCLICHLAKTKSAKSKANSDGPIKQSCNNSLQGSVATV